MEFYGARIFSNILSIKSSEVWPSASASKVRIILWRNTSCAIDLISSGITKPLPASNALAFAARINHIDARGDAPNSIIPSNSRL